jgi:hypothetical protein
VLRRGKGCPLHCKERKIDLTNMVRSVIIVL